MRTSSIHQILFVRHAQTTYSNIYPDITEEGTEQLRQTAKGLHPFIFNGTYPNLKIIASPAVRAQGSARVLVEALQHAGEIITEPLLRDMHVYNWPRAKELFNQCLLNGGRVEDVYDFDDCFEDENIFESRSVIQERFFCYMGQLQAALAQSTEPQCIVAVSHFEVLNHFLRSLWPDAPWLRWASSFRITMEHPTAQHDERTIVSYGERSIQIDLHLLMKKPSLFALLS